MVSKSEWNKNNPKIKTFTEERGVHEQIGPIEGTNNTLGSMSYEVVRGLKDCFPKDITVKHPVGEKLKNMWETLICKVQERNSQKYSRKYSHTVDAVVA